MNLQEIYEEGNKLGYEDGYDWTPVDVDPPNPYPEGSEEAAEWKRGYDEGYEDGKYDS